MVYRKGNKFIEITDLPQFTHKCLLIGKDNHVWKVGSFISDECAKEFEKYLDEFLVVEKEESKGIDTLWQY